MSLDGYYRVSPRIWEEDWTEDGTHLALYLLTNQHRNTEGFYKLKRKYALADLEWLPERFDEALMELRRADFVRWDSEAEIVLIMKALKMQSPSNPNTVTHAVRHLALLPETPLTSVFIGLAERYCERLFKALPEGLPEWFAQPPALSSSSSSNSSSTSSVTTDSGSASQDDVDAQESQTLNQHLVDEGWHPDDVDAVVKRLDERATFGGTPINDPAAWARGVLKSMASCRSADPGEERIFQLDDGTKIRYEPPNGWMEIEEAS